MLNSAIFDEEEKEPVQPDFQISKPEFECKTCLKQFSTISNLKKHIKNVHSEKEKRYIRHIKKDKRVLCKNMRQIILSFKKFENTLCFSTL